MSFSLSGFRPMSITPALSKVYEMLVSPRLCAFKESEDIFSRHQYVYRNELNNRDTLMDMVVRDRQL